mgnify:CR=1 FL=1
MASTYTPIATYTTTGSVASYTFSSIPSTYTDLVLICNNLVENTNQQGYIRFNSDSGTNYSRTVMYGNGTSAASFRGTNQTGLNVGMSANTGGQYIKLDILNYANTTTYKSALDREGNASGSTNAAAFLWRSTSAINSITIASFDGSSSIQSGASLTLYGILAA